MLNYQPVDISKKIWQRGNKKVVVCLVDDVITCAQNSNLPAAELFDSDTVVITDNRIYSPTNYQVFELPASFFGIYYYQPANLSFNPEKNINLSVNRLDPIRQLILLELVKHSPVDNMFDNLNINFNCFMHNSGLDSASLLRNFQTVAEINGIDHDVYYQQLKGSVPIKTHNMTVEQSIVASWANMVVETYSGRDIVAISEKIFRHLVTPCVWILYAGVHTVNFLKSQGFDVLEDVVNHNYQCSEQSRHIQFVSASLQLCQRLKNIPVDKLTVRVQAAARHNQQHLFKMRQQWPTDFAAWWATVLPYVK
jgi:hypothetical protein